MEDLLILVDENDIEVGSMESSKYIKLHLCTGLFLSLYLTQNVSSYFSKEQMRNTIPADFGATLAAVIPVRAKKHLIQ